MTVPIKGHADYLELGDWNATCAVCGRKYKASEMIRQPDGVGPPWGGGMYVCKRDYRPRQPQDFVRGIPDKMATPWAQPPVMLFVGFCTPNGQSAVPGQMEPGCIVPGYLSPSYVADAPE